jgi:hypothetical protein
MVTNSTDSLTALVTGGTSGIGRAAANKLAQLGIHVVVVGRNEERGEKAVAEIRSAGGKADFIASDLRDGGFAFNGDGALFLSSGIGPNGEGDNTIVAFARGQKLQPSQLVSDPELSPLDLAVAPNGNIVASSEHPFGAADAVTSIREYNAANGHLIRVFSADGSSEFRRPRGLRFAPDGTLYCVARDEVMAFDFASGRCLGAVVRFPRLNGQAVALFP